MTGASITYRAHVLCFGSSSIDREPAFIRTCARLRWRAHESITPGLNRTRTPPAIQSGAHILPCAGNWDLAIERTNSLVALARSLFLPALRGDTRLGFNSFGALVKALRSLSFRSLVQHPEKSGRSVFHTLFFPPVLSSAPLLHEEQHAAKGLLNDTKSGARPGKSTARDGNYAC